jgi:hypothetical protein
LRIPWSVPGRRQWKRSFRFLLWAAAPIVACGQAPPAHHPALPSPNPAKADFDACRSHEIRSLPGSHQFASDFLETMTGTTAGDPSDPQTTWGLTADLSDSVPAADRALYISKSIDSGETWTQVARVDSRYFDADIAEGLRNSLAVSPGGSDFVITTQEGAFQVFPQSGTSDARIKPIPGPRIPSPVPTLSLPKKEGDPVRANVVAMTADGKRMIVGYGYFDLNPQLFTYHRDNRGSWIEDGPLPQLPTDLDIFSMQFDNPKRRHPASLYVGTGDQVYRLNFRTKKWTRVDGVGPDSAIHSMTTAGGLHLAACWGVYEPVSPDAVQRVTHANFLLHRAKDEVGPNIRAYGIEVDPARPNRQVLTAITGVYTTRDSGQHWKRLNDLPEGEFHSAHINPDGTVIVSGFVGTFLTNPFSNACSPHLRTRDSSR